jgi:hypothetical protein
MSDRDFMDGLADERLRWLDWLVDIGYGVDFTLAWQPPCEMQDLAEAYAERGWLVRQPRDVAP